MRMITTVAAVLVLAACQSSAPIVGNVDNGKAIFEVGTSSMDACSSCHSTNGRPELGPTLQGIATRAESRIAGKSAHDYLYDSITKPDAYLVEGYAAGQMPNGSIMTAQQIEDVIAYLLTLK